MTFRIITFLVAILVFALLYQLGADIVGIIEPVASNEMDTSVGKNFLSMVNSMWALLPVFLFLGAAAYLLKQAVVVSE